MLTILSVWLQLKEVEAINMTAKKEPKKRGRPAKVVEDVIEELPEVPLRAMILGACNNPTWVRGRIDGFAINVKVPAQIARRLIGKEVSVILITSELGDYYQYIP